MFQDKSFSPSSFSDRSWGVLSVDPTTVQDDPILYPGACFPFGNNGKIRPHRTKRHRESDILFLMR